MKSVLAKLKKHLPEEELEKPKEKSMTCLRDLLKWVTTALKQTDNRFKNVDVLYFIFIFSLFRNGVKKNHGLLNLKGSNREAKIELSKALDPLGGAEALEFMIALDLKPKEEEEKECGEEDAKKSLCPDLKKACPNFGGICAILSECDEKKVKKNCKCKILVSCKSKANKLNIFVEN